MRLFIAIHFSDEVKRVLLHATEDIRRRALSGRFTRPENLHLTLAFIGESDDVAAIRQAVDRSAVPPFDLTVGGFGHFGNLYWVGIRPDPILSGLAERLQSALRESGFDIERRAFKPHITVARKVAASASLHIDVPETGMTVERLSLMKSDRPGGRLTYTEVYGRPL